ncbi:MAG TPA: hypothetical protein VIJ57_06110, partial [Hanamia sp.]
MKRFLMSFCLFCFAISFVSCKKEILPADTCSQIREGLKSDNSDLVRMEINNICKGLNGFVVKDNLQKLTSIISSGCKINATLLCT